MRKAKALGLCLDYYNKTKDPDGHRILKKLIALAYLPAKLIVEGLLEIEKEAKLVGEKAGTWKKWQNFFEYYRREWIFIVKPQNFSVFNAVNRTNNKLERYHRNINEKIGSKPTVKKFVGNTTNLKNKFVNF